MDDHADADLAWLYRETMGRLMNLVAGLTDAELTTSMPACPAWTVRDMVGHLTAIPEDAASGRLKGIPSDEVTAGQVARLAGLPVADVLARWAAAAPDFERMITAHQVWPAVIDVASQEQDIRGAVGRPGARDCAAVQACTPRLLEWLSRRLAGLRIRRPCSIASPSSDPPSAMLSSDGHLRAGPKPSVAGARRT